MLLQRRRLQLAERVHRRRAHVAIRVLELGDDRICALRQHRHIQLNCLVTVTLGHARAARAYTTDSTLLKIHPENTLYGCVALAYDSW